MKQNKKLFLGFIDMNSFENYAMRYAIFLLFSFLLINIYSQDLSTKSKKARKLYEEANSYLIYGRYYEAKENLLKAVAADPQFIEAYLLLGDAEQDQRNFDSAISYYKKSLIIDSDRFPSTHYFLGKLYMNRGNYREAQKYFKNYVGYENANQLFFTDASKNLLNCEFALNALQNPVDFIPINMGKSINSIYSEYFPTMTVDGSSLLFTRLLGEEGSRQQEDFYLSIKNSSDQWVGAQNIGHPLNTQLNEGAATISADGSIIIFTACGQFGNYGPNREGYGSCDLFLTKRLSGNRWMQAINLGPPINTSKWESQPSLSSDGETLYFVREKRTANKRESDIMVSHLDDEGYWGKPEALPKTINTDESETSVFIHPDNRTLYFSSKGHIGMGGSDLFMSQKDINDEWGPALNLGYPINTYNDENSLLVDPNGEIAYFASDREGGLGGLDIYSFELPKELRADPVSYFKGIVYDSITKEVLTASVELIDAIDSKLISRTLSNKQGSFFLTLIPRYDYVINVSKEGYLFYSDGLFINEQFDKLKPYIKNIPLLPLEVGNSVVLKNIFFELDKSNLKPESEAELNKLIDFLIENPKIRVEIGGHTDNQGSYAYNKKLSEERAKSVYEYLTNNGIKEDRLTYKGYSYDAPLENNNTDEGRAKNRRTEFKIIEIN
jgi:outer membrane protein OmpA-like peptidoglycan-associated protein/tetratricopeptide (TPR) repeat protein